MVPCPLLRCFQLWTAVSVLQQAIRRPNMLCRRQGCAVCIICRHRLPPTWSVLRSKVPTNSSTFLNDMMAALLTAEAAAGAAREFAPPPPPLLLFPSRTVAALLLAAPPLLALALGRTSAARAAARAPLTSVSPLATAPVLLLLCARLCRANGGRLLLSPLPSAVPAALWTLVSELLCLSGPWAPAPAAVPPTLLTLPPSSTSPVNDLLDFVRGFVSVWHTLRRMSGELRVTAPTLLPTDDSCSCLPLLPRGPLLAATAAPPPAQMPLLRLLPLERRCRASMIAREGLSMSSRVLSVARIREQCRVTS